MSTRPEILLSVGENKISQNPQYGIHHRQLGNNGDSWLLTLSKVTQQNEGIYSCKVNADPIIRQEFRLIITGKFKQYVCICFY